MRSDTKFSIPSIPNIRDRWADGMDVFKFSCEGGRDRRSGGAETKGVSARQVKTGKKFARKRNHFTKTRCSEQRTGITKKCAYARFYEMPHGFVKSIPLTYERASTAAFPADLSRTDFYTRQRSGCAEWRAGFAFSSSEFWRGSEYECTQ